MNYLLKQGESVLIYTHRSEECSISDLYNYIEGQIVAKRLVNGNDNLYDEPTTVEYTAVDQNGNTYHGNYKYPATKEVFFLRKGDLVDILVSEINRNKRIINKLDNDNNLHYNKIEELMNLRNNSKKR